MTSERPVLWTYEQLCGDLGIPVTDRPSLQNLGVVGICINSHACGPGILHAPILPPDAQNRSIVEGLRRGSPAALTTAPIESFAPDAPVIPVPNVTRALFLMSQVGRARCEGDVVGVTGSVGKSTVKDMVGPMLESFGPTYWHRGNFNDLHSIYRLLACTRPGSRYHVLELASIGPGTLWPKVTATRATVGVVTSARYSHGAAFKTPSALVNEKLQMLDGLEGRRVGVVGRSLFDLDAQGERLLPGKRLGRLLVVGTEAGDDVRLQDVEITPTHTRATARVNGRLYRLNLPGSGRHIAENGLFALAVALGLDLDLEAAAAALANSRLPARRGDRWRVDVVGSGRLVEIIDDAFNASPLSMQALIEALSLRPKARRRVLVVGDMLELGPDEVALHEALAPNVLEARIDLLITVGRLSKHLGDALQGEIEVASFADVAELAPAFPGLLKAGDVVAMKGSSATKLERLVAAAAPNPKHRSEAGAWTVEEASAEELA